MTSLRRISIPLLVLWLLLAMSAEVYSQNPKNLTTDVAPVIVSAASIDPKQTQAPAPPPPPAPDPVTSDPPKQPPTTAPPAVVTTPDPAPQKPSDQPPNPPDPAPTGNPQKGSDTPKNDPTKKPPPTIYTTMIPGGGAVTITSYQVDPSTPPRPQKTGTSADQNNSSSGDSSSNVFTAAIVVVTVVVAAAIGIWIFRKWKLSPSRNFKEKIQPVDFAPRSNESDTAFLRQLHGGP